MLWKEVIKELQKHLKTVQEAIAKEVQEALKTVQEIAIIKKEENISSFYFKYFRKLSPTPKSLLIPKFSIIVAPILAKVLPLGRAPLYLNPFE